MPILGDMVSSSPAAPPSVRPRRVVTDRRGGRSASPYDSFNLGDHVGDDPAAVAANRGAGRPRAGRRRPTGWSGCTRCTARASPSSTGRRTGRCPRPTRWSPAPRGWCSACWSPTASRCCSPTRSPGSSPRSTPAGRGSGRASSRPTLSAMASLGARARHVTALLGPAVCGALLRGARADAGRAGPRRAGRRRAHPRRAPPGLDLRAGLAELLTRAGIPEVVHDPRCTVEDPHLFSHRRDGVTGRQAGLVWLG